MTKAELMQKLSDLKGIQFKEAEEIINALFDLMSEALKENKRIEIRGFGSFVNREYASYRGRNPKTGELVDVPPKRVPFFKVGKELKESIESGKDPLPISQDGEDDE